MTQQYRRTGTYVAFHAEGTSNQTESDMKYYRLLQAWNVREDNDFHFVNSHDKTSAVRDTSQKETLRKALVTRLLRSKNMILIIGDTTRLDNDWIPFEIAYAVDNCGIPIIAAYTEYDRILNPRGLQSLWPAALKARIENNTANVIHIPFKQAPLIDAVDQFNVNNLPKGGGLGIYSIETYQEWGL